MIGLQRPNYKTKLVHASGYNSDIIDTLNSGFSTAASQSAGVRFSGSNLTEKGRAIWNYLKNNIKYQRDPSGEQVIQLPSRMIHDTKSGDCKSLALAAAAFMHNNNFKNVRLRYASYSKTDKTPSHVYAVGSDESGREIIIDPVYKQFNKELPYQSKTDHTMRISVLSGMAPDRIMIRTAAPKKPASPEKMAQRLLSSGKIKAGGIIHNVVSNYVTRLTGANFPRYSDQQKNQYLKVLMKKLPSIKYPFIRDLVSNEIRLLESGSFAGNIVTMRSSSITGITEEIGRLSLKKIFKKVGKGLKKISPKNILRGIKTVGLVLPRKAFLALVSVNARGIASRLSQAPESELKKIWVDRFGGKLSALQSAISRGRKKKPLVGASRKVRAIRGIGYVVDDSFIGDAGAGSGSAAGGKSIDVGALISAAAPIIQIIMKLLSKIGSKAPAEAAGSGEDTEFNEAAIMAQDVKKDWTDYVSSGLEIAQATGIIPDYPKTPKDERIDAALSEGDDHADDGGGSSFELKPSMAIIGLGAIGVYLLMRKK